MRIPFQFSMQSVVALKLFHCFEGWILVRCLVNDTSDAVMGLRSGEFAGQLSFVAVEFGKLF